MLKKIALGSIFASVLALTYIQSTASVQDQSELTKENIEALAFSIKLRNGGTERITPACRLRANA